MFHSNHKKLFFILLLVTVTSLSISPANSCEGTNERIYQVKLLLNGETQDEITAIMALNTSEGLVSNDEFVDLLNRDIESLNTHNIAKIQNISLPDDNWLRIYEEDIQEKYRVRICIDYVVEDEDEVLNTVVPPVISYFNSSWYVKDITEECIIAPACNDSPGLELIPAVLGLLGIAVMIIIERRKKAL